MSVEMVSSSLEHKETDNTYTTKRGIVFEILPVSRYIVVDINDSIPIPKPPKVMIEEKGREEENPNDPDYLAALREANIHKATAVTNAYLGLGTRVLTLPEDIEPPESTEWSDDLAMFTPTTKVPIKGKARYVAWIRYYAVLGDEFEQLTTAVMRGDGGVTTEEDTKKAEERFRGTEEGDTTKGVSTQVEG